jgi:transposase
VRWLDAGCSRRRKKRKDFLKLHFIVDATSLLILSFKATPPFKSDSKQVDYLLSFIKDLGRLCADKAYLSRKICNMVAKLGGEPYIAIKKNILRVRSKGSKAWKEMLFLYRRSKKLYLKNYHRRSLAETAVSTVKRRFNHALYSKKRRGQKNEIRLKVLTYNLSIIARLPAQFE